MTQLSSRHGRWILACGTVLLSLNRAEGLNPNHDCAFCHVTHASAGPNLIAALDIEVMCLTCHGPGGTSTLTVDVHTNRQGSIYSPFLMSCIDCHDPHRDKANWLGGTNRKLVGTDADGSGLARLVTPNSGVREVVFESLGSGAGEPTLHSFADSDEDGNGYYDGVCETCHTQTGHHRNNQADLQHYPGASCTACHPHDAGFLPTGGSCTACHTSPQDNGDGVPAGGRRAVVGEFALASHHVQGDVQDSDCLVCHDLSRHQQGAVRLKNVDDATNPSAVVVLTGDPSADPAEAAKLSTICLACHDADAAGGAVPFSDGVPPPVIDADAWALASHNLGGAAGAMSCFGDGEMFGCHGTGHGSAKRKLQAPSDASQPSVPGDPRREEEGMCYTCHDADGPASTNMELQFQLTSHHNVSALDQSDGSKVECTDCHNPHTARPGMLLADPDSGGTLPWSGDGVGFCLTCHDDAPPTNVTFAPNAPGTGYDKSAFVGSTHATVLGADSCRGCHDPHGSTYLSMLKGEYVTADYNVYSTGDGDYQACWNCHDEDATINQENAFKRLHKEHVRGSGMMGVRGPCIICHDVHAPYDRDEPGLISFDFSVQNGYDIHYIGGRDAGTSFWIDTGANRGYCYIRCHGKDHKPKKYDRIDASTVDCTTCHATAQDNGDGVPPGGRRAVVGEFARTSHHVQGGSPQMADCLVCHDLSQHQQGYVRLKDADQNTLVYNYDLLGPAAMEDFCLACHDTDGAAAGPGLQPFSDGRTVPNVKGVSGSLWTDSAHANVGFARNGNTPLTCLGDGFTGGCHAPAHGSDDIKLLSTDQGVQGLDAFCYNCHDGAVQNQALSGPGLADTIQGAFGMPERHDLGTAFNVGGDTYTLQCTTCHNPHVVTGKHWDVASGVSPITRPDLAADPSINPRAMGNRLWGAAPGEKMDDFAALATGTGGWYYSIARGGQTVWDQPAVYQPPKTAGGYNFEFSGDVLPDYTTLCLDCHSYRMSAADPPVNWGQGIACTDNSVDPPDQRIECGAQHGLAAAGKPSYMSDSGTPGNWGASGNPDVLFQMNYVTRGRGAGHFMRWPYDSAEKNAGINFVMSCTDCHEAHGSGAASMLRSTINAYGPGTSNWNTMCNNCHYYYGGQHAGMSCGNASCHEANSIHRIIHVTDSGAGTQLRITAAGHEGDYQRPTFTPEIAAVEGNLGDDQLLVTFTDGVWTHMDLTGALVPSDFWLFDEGGNNPRAIVQVTHTPGQPTALLTMSAPLTEADLTTDILATTGHSIWKWYDGGYVNWATGTIPAQAVSAGPWPVRISAAVTLTAAQGYPASDTLQVTFSKGVYTDPGASGALDPSDFVFVDGDQGRAIVAVDHNPGDAIAMLTLSLPLDSLDDIGVDTLAAASANAIFDASDNSVPPVPVTVTSTACPLWGTSFELNEPAGSVTAQDASGLLVGTVGNPAVAFQNGDGYFHGDGTDDSTYLYFTNPAACFDERRTFTYEVRFTPFAVDLDSEVLNPGNALDRTVQVLFDRRYTYNVKISRADFWGDRNPPPGRAFVYVWYRPNHEPEGGRAWHQAFGDGGGCYIEADHWYQLRLVFNSDRAGGIPVDFFLDDQGTDGLGTGERWAGYRNCTRPPDPTDTYRSTEGNEIEPVSGKSAYPFSIGAYANNKNFAMNGLIDWLTYVPLADYSGVDAPAPTEAVAGDAQVEITWGAVPGATAYNLYWDMMPGVTPSTGTLISGVTSPYTHGGLTDGTTYYYVVTAMKDVDGLPGDEEIPSSQVKAMPVHAAPSAPPDNVVASGFAKAVQLTWDDAPFATSYNIYWSDSPGVTPANGTRIAGATSPYVHVSRTNGTRYFYVVTSVNGFGEHPVASAEVSAAANPHPSPTAVAGDGQIEISWSDVAGAMSYNLYWDTDPAVMQATANQITDVVSPYVHNGLTNGTSYYYIVTAVHPTGETFGPYSVSATPQAP